MSTNVSKQKREDLLAKIKAIRTYIATAPQDENTANLLAYLSELEKDVGAKKYGLVFEEHREEIDEVLSTHTPVLTDLRVTPFATVVITMIVKLVCITATPAIIAPSGADSSLPMIPPTWIPKPLTV